MPVRLLVPSSLHQAASRRPLLPLDQCIHRMFLFQHIRRGPPSCSARRAGKRRLIACNKSSHTNTPRREVIDQLRCTGRSTCGPTPLSSISCRMLPAAYSASATQVALVFWAHRILIIAIDLAGVGKECSTVCENSETQHRTNLFEKNKKSEDGKLERKTRVKIISCSGLAARDRAHCFFAILNLAAATVF